MKPLRHIALCLAVLLFTIPVVKAAPSESAESASPAVIRSAYCQQVGEGAAASDELFVFVSQETEWPEPLKISAGVSMKGKQEFLEAGALQMVAESGRSLSYLILVDHSNSMNSVSGSRNVVRFASELVRHSKDISDVSYALATFGKDFQVEQDFTTDEELFQEAVEQIKYGEMASDPAKAILAATDYLDGCARDEGELVNLILITDGIPEKTDADSLALETVAKRLEAVPSILVHTFGLGNQNREESVQGLDTLASMGLGIHVATPDTTAAKAARQITDMVEGLYAFQFSTGQRQSEQTFDVGLYFNGQSVAAMRIPNLGQAGTTPVSDGNTTDTPGENTPGASEPPTENNGGEGGKEEALPEDGEGASSSGNGTAAGTGGASPSGSQSDGGEDKKGIPALWIAAGVAGLLILALIGFLFLRRRQPIADDNSEHESVCMILEVISGECATKERKFYLSDEFIIGRSRKCDVVWKDNGMAPQSVRIFLSNHAICIEDIGSTDGVYLGGMRLHNANRLRSGDEIAIGSARFRFKF